MSPNRDDFNSDTKRILASRVAYRCCFPDCSRITIGPNSSNEDKVVILGEAAHINAAAPGGPRYSTEMSSEQRKSVTNGIWLCRPHARLIDADHEQYSPETLKQWKQIAEGRAYIDLKELSKDKIQAPTTLVSLDVNLIFEAVWKAVEGSRWSFIVIDFVIGDEYVLRNYDNASDGMLDYIVIESQGEGRLLSGGVDWRINEDGDFEIAVNVLPRAVKRDPHQLGGDMALDHNHDLDIYNGDLVEISGVLYAKQLIEQNLSQPLGAWRFNPLLGSLFSHYYHQYGSDRPMLDRLMKIELTRLATIPPYQVELGDEPELNFIDRIIKVNILSESGGIVSIFLSLQWGDGSQWSGTIRAQLYLGTGEKEDEMPDFLKEFFEPNQIEQFKRLTSKLDNSEIKGKRTTNFAFQIFNEQLTTLMNSSDSLLEKDVYHLFLSHEIFRTIGDNCFPFLTSVDLERYLILGNVDRLGLRIELKGFKRAGISAFDMTSDLFIFFRDYHYEIGTSPTVITLRKTYDVLPDRNDLASIAQFWVNSFMKQINRKIMSLPQS